MRGLQPKSNKSRNCKDSGVESSKMGRQMFMMKTEVVSQSSVMSNDLVQSADQKCVKDNTSQSWNFHANFPNFMHCSPQNYHT
jgi:hypothetical protein